MEETQDSVFRNWNYFSSNDFVICFTSLLVEKDVHRAIVILL